MAERLQRSKFAAVLLALALGIGAGTALATTSFSDPVGDVEGGVGPDITSISVSHTRSTVTFRFRFTKAPPLGVSARGGWVDMLLIGIDAPPRSLKRTTSGWAGLDYYAGLHGRDKTAIVVKASPTRPSQPRKVVARPKVTFSGRALTFSVSRSALGSPSWFEFVVAAGREMSDQATGGGSDNAPNRGAFHYKLRK